MKSKIYPYTAENSIHVMEKYRGQGVASRLMEHMLKEAHGLGLHTVVALITSTNGASIALHQKMGYELIGSMREVGWKFGSWQDMVIMQKIL
ncbi:MAG: GNAT family N-acetyltransferase [Bacillota bacterium]